MDVVNNTTRRGSSYNDALNTNGAGYLGLTPAQYEEYSKLFKGTDFEEQFEANPYRTLSYQQSAWDQLWSGIFNTGYDKAYAEQSERSKQYVSELLDAMRQQDYNSQINQASLERQAGLNPDLTGLGSNAVGTSPDMAPEQGVQFNAGDPLSVLQSAVSALDLIGGLTEKFTGVFTTISKNKADVDSIDLDNEQKLFDLTDQILSTLSPGSYATSENGEVTLYHKNPDYKEGSLDSLQSLEFIPDANKKKVEIPKRLLKRFDAIFNDVANSWRDEGTRYASYVDFLNHRKGVYDPYTGAGLDDKAFDAFIRPFQVLMESSLQSYYESEQSESGYRSDYFGALDGKVQGEAETEGYKGQKSSNQVMKTIKEAQAKALQDLKNLADDPNTNGFVRLFARTALIVLPVVLERLSFSVNGNASVSRSSSQSFGHNVNQSYSSSDSRSIVHSFVHKQ